MTISSEERIIRIDPILQVPAVDIGTTRYFCTDSLYKTVLKNKRENKIVDELFHFFEGELNIASLPEESPTISFLLDLFENKINLENAKHYNRIKNNFTSNHEQDYLVSSYFLSIFSSLKPDDIMCNQVPIHGMYIALAPKEVPTFNFIYNLFNIRKTTHKSFN